MKLETSSGGHVGNQGGFVKKQDQTRALTEVRRCGAGLDEASGLGEKLLREGRAMKWRGARHEATPRLIGQRVFREDTPSILAASEGREPYRYL
jgi:hypothetical protein